MVTTTTVVHHCWSLPSFMISRHYCYQITSLVHLPEESSVLLSALALQLSAAHHRTTVSRWYYFAIPVLENIKGTFFWWNAWILRWLSVQRQHYHKYYDPLWRKSEIPRLSYDGNFGICSLTSWSYLISDRLLWSYPPSVQVPSIKFNQP